MVVVVVAEGEEEEEEAGGGRPAFLFKSVPDVDFSCGRSVEAWRDKA